MKGALMRAATRYIAVGVTGSLAVIFMVLWVGIPLQARSYAKDGAADEA